jgi:hypothetical protein
MGASVCYASPRTSTATPDQDFHLDDEPLTIAARSSCAAAIAEASSFRSSIKRSRRIALFSAVKGLGRAGQAGHDGGELGKAAFYRQAEMSLANAYRYAPEMMTENIMARDAEEGIGAALDLLGPDIEQADRRPFQIERHAALLVLTFV